MKIYSVFGFKDFIVCLGYKGLMIKQYCLNYNAYACDLTVDYNKNTVIYHHKHPEAWRVTLVDTGIDTMTGGRIKRIEPYVHNQTFMLTYGDGVADVNIRKLVKFHKKHGKSVTVTAVQPEGRFGALEINLKKRVVNFSEKPKGDHMWINGGFFVLEPDIFKYIKDDSTYWEREPLKTLSRQGQIMAYIHSGFWKGMDTLRDKKELDMLWNSGNPPWKVW